MIICQNGTKPLNHNPHNSGTYFILIPKFRAVLYQDEMLKLGKLLNKYLLLFEFSATLFKINSLVVRTLFHYAYNILSSVKSQAIF
jgi:hypothetical protein